MKTLYFQLQILLEHAQKIHTVFSLLLGALVAVTKLLSFTSRKVSFEGRTDRSEQFHSSTNFILIVKKEKNSMKSNSKTTIDS